VSAVRVERLSVSLDHTPILTEVDLEVAEREWVTIVGPNGAGKSTLLRAISGGVKFTGTALIFGVPTSTLNRRERARLVAVVAQNPVTPPGMTVFDYVLLGRTPYIGPLGRESRTDVQVVNDVLDSLDLAHFGARRLDSLSGGERQRTFLARALAQGAKILLLDEPTSALDIGYQQDVLELVDGLRRERGLSVLATMHDLSIAGEYADRMVMLSRGAVAAAGKPEEVLTEELLAAHYKARVRVIQGEHGPLVAPIRGTSTS
jgi:iron complex transport system ATP-binding protein